MVWTYIFGDEQTAPVPEEAPLDRAAAEAPEVLKIPVFAAELVRARQRLRPVRRREGLASRSAFHPLLLEARRRLRRVTQSPGGC